MHVSNVKDFLLYSHSMEENMEKEKYLSHCGLYCELCGARNRTPIRAKELVDSLKRGEFEEWGPSFIEFDHFWKLLNQLANIPEDKCCKTMKCGHPDCSIRKCAKQKKIETCAFCNEYPCDKITRFVKNPLRWLWVRESEI